MTLHKIVGYDDPKPEPPPDGDKPYTLDPADFPNGTILRLDEATYAQDYTPGNNGVQAFWDPNAGYPWNRDNGGAAKLTMPGDGGANGCGNWTVRGWDDPVPTVGVALDFMVDEEYVTQETGSGNGPKLWYMYWNTPPCQHNSFVQENTWGRRIVQCYTRCGSGRIQERMEDGDINYTPSWNGGSESYCAYNFNDNINCAELLPGVWCKVVYEITNLGGMTQRDDTRLEAWYWRSNSNKWQKIFDYVMDPNKDSVDRLNVFSLTTYCTNRNGGIGSLPYNAWYKNALFNPGPIRDVYGVEA